MLFKILNTNYYLCIACPYKSTTKIVILLSNKMLNPKGTLGPFAVKYALYEPTKSFIINFLFLNA